jgi:hypothetical protein
MRVKAASAFKVAKAVSVILLWCGISWLYTFMAPDKLTFIGCPYSADAYAPLSGCATEVYFGNENKLDGWMFKSPNADKVLLFSHGLGRNVGVNCDRAAALAHQGVSVFAYDYRGTGKSPGKMNERSMVEDSVSAYDLLINKFHYQPSQIIGYGESLGSAVTAQLSWRRKLAGIILVASFPTWRAAAFSAAPLLVRLYPESSYPIFDSASALKLYYGPTLIIHGGKDDIIAPDLARHLFAECGGSPKTFVFLPGSLHDYVINQPPSDKKLFADSIKDFVHR